MKMNHKLKTLAIAIGLASLVVLFRAYTNDEAGKNVRSAESRDGVSNSSLKSESEREKILSMTKEDREQEHKSWMGKKWEKAFATPINFWGKVVDQDGNPIQGASIEITLLDERTQHLAKRSNRKYVKTSDTNGLFELLKKKGATLYAKASKEKYSSLDGETGEGSLSSREIYFAFDEALPRYQPPTKKNPTIFVLRKKNPIANLVHSRMGVNLSKDGKAHTVNLGGVDKTMAIEVRCWSAAPLPFTYDKYDWRAEIRVVEGGLKPITEINTVEAPTDEYQASYKIDMNTNLGPNEWSVSNYRPRDFWIKFDDGTYAKARIEIQTGRKHKVDVEVWCNLDGTNNFEQ